MGAQMGASAIAFRKSYRKLKDRRKDVRATRAINAALLGGGGRTTLARPRGRARRLVIRPCGAYRGMIA